MTTARAEFRVGQLVHHTMFDYRGVVVDVDADFQGDDEWYDVMARSRPPKDEPWYHVLVDGKAHMTYVAQRNLKPDGTNRPIVHPLLSDYFSKFDGSAYVLRDRAN